VRGLFISTLRGLIPDSLFCILQEVGDLVLHLSDYTVSHFFFAPAVVLINASSKVKIKSYLSYPVRDMSYFIGVLSIISNEEPILYLD
jgi:hypothetical protein